MESEIWSMIRTTLFGVAGLGLLYFLNLVSGTKLTRYIKIYLVLAFLIVGGMYFYGSFDKHK